MVNRIAFIFALAGALFIQGAVPFIAVPTLGQAVWTVGFSQSFLNSSVFSIYAHNIGAPEPAAMAFGLSGGWLTALLINFGFIAPDAYSAMVCVWMSISFCSSYFLARYFSVSPGIATVAAFSWLTMPVTWGHASYSMLSIGIGLLPLYFLISIKIFGQLDSTSTSSKFGYYIWFLLYPIICIISVFMDGYSFMMFAVGSTILWTWILICSNKKHQKYLFTVSFPNHLFSFILAYILYKLYIGSGSFARMPIDFFRGWGADLTFFLIPTKGIHWIPDLIKWNLPRSGNQFFGDASVWTTSFSIPVVIGAIWSACKSHRNNSLVVGLVLISFFGFYMSLGPSLKFNSVKPEQTKIGSSMPAKYAVAPTGSRLLSENLPGFRQMRASYRWCALGVFGAWCLMVLAMASTNNRKTIIIAVLILSFVSLINLPHIFDKFAKDKANRRMFLSINSELIEGMRNVVHKGEKVAFVPWRNDFLVNYIGSALDVTAFNIGGDKNYSEARKHWPKTMKQFPMAKVDKNFSERVLLMLARHEVEVAILPYIDMLWAAHRWPYPIQFKNDLKPKVDQLIESGFVDVTDDTFYATVRLKSKFKSMDEEEMETLIRLFWHTSSCRLKLNKFDTSTPHKVGVIQNGKLVSVGREGFLLYGPYCPITPGKYHLIIYGEGSVSDYSWADVVSGKGAIQHAKFRLKETISKGNILAEGFIEINMPVNDIEIRVYVGKDDEVILKGYALVIRENES